MVDLAELHPCHDASTPPRHAHDLQVQESVGEGKAEEENIKRRREEEIEEGGRQEEEDRQPDEHEEDDDDDGGRREKKIGSGSGGGVESCPESGYLAFNTQVVLDRSGTVVARSVVTPSSIYYYYYYYIPFPLTHLLLLIPPSTPSGTERDTCFWSPCLLQGRRTSLRPSSPQTLVLPFHSR